MTKEDFLGVLLDNASRARILRAFVLNPNESFTLPVLAKRAGVSLTSATHEARKLREWGIVKRGKTIAITIGKGEQKRTVSGKQRVDTWIADENFSHLSSLSVFVRELSPVKHSTIMGALKRTGKVSTLILSGTFMGDASRPADILVALDTVNERRVDAAVRSLEPLLGREIRYAAFSTPEFRYRMTVQDRLIRDTLDYPHLVLLDRTRLV